MLLVICAALVAVILFVDEEVKRQRLARGLVVEQFKRARDERQ